MVKISIVIFFFQTALNSCFTFCSSASQQLPFLLCSSLIFFSSNLHYVRFYCLHIFTEFKGSGRVPRETILCEQMDKKYSVFFLLSFIQLLL